MKLSIMEVIFLVLLIIIISVTSFFSDDSNTYSGLENSTSYLSCKNLSLENTTFCLNDYVKSIFIYNITDDKLDLNLEDLKERGGDCKDWAELYIKMAQELGFKTEYVSFYTTDDRRHAVMIISDETGYCVIDQRKYKCFRLNVSLGDERGN